MASNNPSEARIQMAALLSDFYLKEAKAVVHKEKATSSHEEASFQWRKRDGAGNPVVRRRSRSRCVEKRGGIQFTPSSPKDPQLRPMEDFKAQEHFDRNMQRLGEILKSCPVVPDELQPSTSSSWPLRQSAAQERWKEARPYHLKCLLDTEAVGQELCCRCSQAAVIRCTDCLPADWLLESLPSEWFCEDCDVFEHRSRPLHNRDSIVDGFLKAIPPSTVFKKTEADKYTTLEQACLLPTKRPPRPCSCDTTNITVSAGRAVIMISMKGRYDLHLPLYTCNDCTNQWTLDVQDLIRSGYWPASSHSQTIYKLDVFSSFEDLKITAPGFSRQAFAKWLEQRTLRFGRSGQVNGDSLQRSFLEFRYCKFEEDQLCNGAPFTCPACTPEMVAVSADGNRKLYRFRRTGGTDEAAYFEGVFLVKDCKVSSFVDDIRSVVKTTQGRGTCGASQWAAARETARRATKLDEEGVEVAVCRHGYILKGLNMYRGEIFAYPLYLQKELQATANVQFFATDVACKYWPYLEKVAGVLAPLQGLLGMKPFLSIMHARAHATKCEIKWSGRNQEGAGTTIGEEVEQVNSYLSRCALTTKYMSKAARVDMLTIHAMGWNQRKSENLHQALATRYVKTCQKAVEEAARLSELKEELNCSEEMALQWTADVQQWAICDTTDTITDPAQQTLQQSIEGLFVSIHQRKHSLYRQNDSNKLRHRLRQKLAEEKRRLFDQIRRYNTLAAEDKINEALIEGRLAGLGSGTEAQIWPWDANISGSSVSITTKKKIHDQQMLTMRLQEERSILVVEMAQHCTSLQNLALALRTKISREEGHEGLSCLLKRRIYEVEGRFQLALQYYTAALGPCSSLLGNVDEEEECDCSPDVSEEEEEEEEADDKTP